jgi:hypothetical protein
MVWLFKRDPVSNKRLKDRNGAPFPMLLTAWGDFGGRVSSASDAIRLGLHPRMLYPLRDSGKIQQVGRGLYRLSTAPPLTSPDLVPVAIRMPRAVICLISALAHHGLTTQVPHTVDLALLGRLYPFDGALLVEEVPVGLTDAFSLDPARAMQWKAFVRRSRFDSQSGLDELVAQVRSFASAPLSAAARNDSFRSHSKPSGPWA